jgi:Cof subfamily protein (haloacid dehalogenase superfamily)
MYKMIVMDVDGTILDCEGRVPEHTKRALLSLNEKGFITTIATGRMLKRAEPVAKEIRINAPLICYNGALIVDIYNGNRIFEKPIPPQNLAYLINVIKSWDYQIVVYHNEDLVVEELNERTNWYIGLCAGVDYFIVPDLIQFIKNKGISSYKLFAIADIQRPKPVDKSLLELLMKDYEVSHSRKGHMEITTKGVNKGNAVRLLAERLKIDRNEIIAVGDGCNDIAMLKYAGLGVAMGNAEDRIKRYAKYTTLSNRENGFLKIIKEFCI